MGKDNFVASIKESDLKEGQMKAVRIKGKPVLLVRQDGQVFALSNICPHMGCSFERGLLSGYLVICPCHGWKFDIHNGQYMENALTALTCYRCKIEDGRVHVEMPHSKGFFG